MVVVIDLQKDDDPQVIFETLNARGGTAAAGGPAAQLHLFPRQPRQTRRRTELQALWARFDDEFWREEVKQGRLTRPRSDLFMQHFLASGRGRISRSSTSMSSTGIGSSATSRFRREVRVEALARQGDQFRASSRHRKMIFYSELCSFLEAFDIRTAYPLLLALADAGLDDDEWKAISTTLESYLLRRAVCNLGTKNYNRIFLGLTRALRKEGFSADKLESRTADAKPGSPASGRDDANFKEAWLHRPLYGPLNSPKSCISLAV